MKLLLILTFLLSSCASYVQSIHKKIDNENRAKRYPYRGFAQPGDRRPINNPVTLGGVPSANTQANMPPGVQREYQSRGARRYRADDLKDNDSDGSLWSGKNSESFLFVKNNMKKQGDIIIIDVYAQLKKQIQDELNRNFPEKPTKKTAKDGDSKEPAPEKPAEVAQDSPDKVFDKISATVVEQVNQDYILIRGRKEIMYKNFKRYFEIQALVSQKDIAANDTIASKKVLEPKIKVLRY